MEFGEDRGVLGLKPLDELIIGHEPNLGHRRCHMRFAVQGEVGTSV